MRKYYAVSARFKFSIIPYLHILHTQTLICNAHKTKHLYLVAEFLPPPRLVSHFVFAGESCLHNLLLRIQYVKMCTADSIPVICSEETTFY